MSWIKLLIARRPPLLYIVWAVLVGSATVGFVRGEYSVTFVGLGTLLLTFVPIYSGRWLHIDLPIGFVGAIAAFLCATLLLGEVGDFYEKYWWWDIALHVGSAIGLGFLGVILILILVKGDKLSAAPITVSFFAFCFAVMVGVLWEIFEFSLDQIFGLNTQRSGLVDTMWDLIVDCLGAAIGGSVGFVYLKGLRGGPLSAALREFRQKNARFFGGV